MSEKTIAPLFALNDALMSIRVDASHSLVEPRADAIKQRIADAYSTFDISTPWNWGMSRADVHASISEYLKDYDTGDSDGYSEQLYFYVFKKVPASKAGARRILEVGCGAGRGLALLSKFESSASFVGLDLTQKAVDAANDRFARPGALTYVQGDAEDIPFGNAEFDAVINVESAHNYPNPRRFLSEVTRVLRPGGFFSIADVYTDGTREFMERCKLESKAELEWVEDCDISEDVKAAIRMRMEPDSAFRRRIGRGAVLLSVMYACGSVFAYPSFRKDPPDFLSLVTSYRHALARKF